MANTARKSPRASFRPQIESLEVRDVPSAVTGPSSSASPYVVPTLPGVDVTSILTVGDSVNLKPDGVTPYRMVGIPDGLGAFDNGDGTFTLLINHEIASGGAARAHGGTGAFVSEWVIRKDTLEVVGGRDLIENVVLTSGGSLNFTRFCSADLAPVSAFLFGGLGTADRIFLNGEETSGGRAFAHVVTGDYAHTSFELPALGRVAFENSTANPLAQLKTVVASADDTTPQNPGAPSNNGGRVYIYVGTKTNTGTPVEKAGLTNGANYAVQVTGLNLEDRNAPAAGAFTLVPAGTGGTQFLRPEDVSWDPAHPNVLYFATTDRYDQVKDGLGTTAARSRLYKLTFADISDPTAGGTIEAVLDGTEAGNMFDNITVDEFGRVLLQEDVGGQAHNGKVWLYDAATDRLTQLAQHDPARFGDLGRAATSPFNNDEESSGVIDVSDILGPGTYLLDVQAHYGLGGELVEGGQLLKMTVPTPTWAAADAASTVYRTAVTGNVLANDAASPATVLSHTNPANGSLTLNADGSYSYTPNAGFVGQDSFSYTAVATQVYKTTPVTVNTPGGPVNMSGFGSAVTAVPGTTDEVYGLTDRGPNVDGPNGSKIEPITDFAPAIGRFKLVNGQAVLLETITLKAADGTPYNGRVSTVGSTGETITDLDGNVLPASPYGYDPEGIVALADGTFWVSDEYGPFIRHFGRDGREIEADRLAPGSGLPAELALRRVNRGMEGLTITPDGTTLVGIMQSPLMNGITTNGDNNKTTPVRIVTINLATRATREYLYLLDNPAANGTSVSEITALSDTTFLVDERDGNYAPGGYKKLFQIDLAGATDVGPNSPLINGTTVTYDAVKGLVFSTPAAGTPIELLVKNQNTGTAANTLAGKGVIAVQKTLYLDVSGLLKAVDPTGGYFSHDKLEGVTLLPGGKLVISNDSDFGIDGITNTAAPFQLHSKTSPATGEVDNGEFLVLDLAHLAAPIVVGTVTVGVDKATPTVTVVDTGGVYTGQPFAATDATVTGVPADGVIATFGDQLLSYTYFKNGVALPGAPSAPGAYTVVAHYAGNAYYTAADSAPAAFNIVYAVANKTDRVGPVKSGSTLPVKLMLTDAAGANVGSPAVAVTAGYLVGPNGQKYAANDPGNSNPGGKFKYDAATGTYQFNLKTIGLPAGVYKFVFFIDGDPVEHSISFEVR